MTMQIKGLGALAARLAKLKKRGEEDARKARNAAMMTLLDALAENIPVWSGRTLASIRISGRPQFAQLQGDPSPEEAVEFGATSLMALGEEPMRQMAMSLAEEELGNLQGIKGPAYLTIHSEAWGLVEKGKAPTPEGARNTAVVSAIAIARTRAAHPGVFA